MNLYPRFLQGSKVTCVINQITILELPVGNQTQLINEIAVEDLLSEEPTTGAQQLIASNPLVEEAVAHRSADWTRALLAQTPPSRYRYVPSDALIRKWLPDARATPSFFVPLVVYNSGAKYADIASGIMIAELAENRNNRWAYTAYFEMDEVKLIHIHEPTKDVEKLLGFFAGAAVPPSGSVKLNLQFVPHHSAKGIQLSTRSLVPGKYDLLFFGIDPKGRQVFRVRVKGYPLEEETLLCSFKNVQWTYSVGLDSHILKILHR